MTYDIGDPGPGLGQVQQSGGVKLVNRNKHKNAESFPISDCYLVLKTPFFIFFFQIEQTQSAFLITLNQNQTLKRKLLHLFTNNLDRVNVYRKMTKKQCFVGCRHNYKWKEKGL